VKREGETGKFRWEWDPIPRGGTFGGHERRSASKKEREGPGGKSQNFLKGKESVLSLVRGGRW